VTYFNGSMPVLAHDEEDVVSFPMINARFSSKVVNAGFGYFHSAHS